MGPDMPLFMKFQKQWDSLDESEYRWSDDVFSLLGLAAYQGHKKYIVQVQRHVLEYRQHQTEDYKELVFLS